MVFPELDGVDAFDAVSDTLDLIEALAPRIVIPGHGPVFAGVESALAFARQRLDGFAAQPLKHLTYGAKVLLKFKLLEAQSLDLAELMAWATATNYLAKIHRSYFSGIELAPWLSQLTADLVRSGAATQHGTRISNAG